MPIPADKPSSIEISEYDLTEMLLAGEYEELFKLFIHDCLMVEITFQSPEHLVIPILYQTSRRL